jgi:RND superfamily putative drug exporter
MLSHVLPIASATDEVVVIIGMAVGVDYSLFYLRREREERAKGRSFAEALRIASLTSGRTIGVSGLTVIVALSALFLVGAGPFSALAAGTIAMVAIAVLGSLTALPALLAWLGPRSDAGRIPLLSRRREAARPSRTWAALARGVVARPVIWGGLAAIALLALASPALGLRTGQPPVDAPYNLTVVQTELRIQQAFPQAPAPAQIVVSGSGVTGARVMDALSALRDRTTATGPVRGLVTTTSIGGGQVPGGP